MALDSRVAHDARLIGLLEDEVETAMAAAEDSPLLPMPQDKRAVALAHFVLAQPCAPGSPTFDCRERGDDVTSPFHTNNPCCSS